MHHNFSVAKRSPVTMTVKRGKMQNSISIPTRVVGLRRTCPKWMAGRSAVVRPSQLSLLRRTNIPSTQNLSAVLWLPALEPLFCGILFKKFKWNFQLILMMLNLDSSRIISSSSSLSCMQCVCGLGISFDGETCMWQSGRCVCKILKSFRMDCMCHETARDEHRMNGKSFLRAMQKWQKKVNFMPAGRRSDRRCAPMCTHSSRRVY